MILNRARSLNHLVLPTATANATANDSAANKTSLNQKGIVKGRETHWKRPPAHLHLKRLLPLSRWVFSKCFPAHHCHFDLKIAIR